MSETSKTCATGGTIEMGQTRWESNLSTSRLSRLSRTSRATVSGGFFQHPARNAAHLSMRVVASQGEVWDTHSLRLLQNPHHAGHAHRSRGVRGDHSVSRRMLEKPRRLTRPAPAVISPSRPESAKTASSPRDAPFHGKAAAPQLTFVSRFTPHVSRLL